MHAVAGFDDLERTACHGDQKAHLAFDLQP